MIPFYAETVPLKESNLIEASAGTGKTHSIAILVVRLLLERKITIQEILMVTFTKMAVAELETRIRLFVRMAHQASRGEIVADTTIQKIVHASILSITVQETERLLNNAVLFLDETSVLTIHSFCQRSLKEYSFETGQIFGAEAMDEGVFNELKTDQMNSFWRRHIVIIEKDLLRHLTSEALSRGALAQIINNELGGKKLIELEPREHDLLTVKNQKKIEGELQLQLDIITDSRTAAIEYIENNRVELLNKVESHTNANKKFTALFNDYDVLLETIRAAAPKTAYVRDLFGEILALLAPLAPAEEEKNRILNLFANKIYQLAIAEIGDEIRFRKESKSMLTFDDMIDKLHEAVVNKRNEKLIEAMRGKFKAVFIDEFQDTDKKQYEIFNVLFGKDTILFFIGDPKQSIYGWRKADLNTYFKAGAEVSNRFSMNTNYRSSDEFIMAQNGFFKPQPNFDTFYFGTAVDSIQYTAVDSPTENKSGQLLLGDAPVTPITFYNHKNKEELLETVTANVIQLLNVPHLKIRVNGILRHVKPSDIGILVRSNKMGSQIKANLAAYHIPAITIDETKLSETIEAQEMLFVLKAVIDINASNINKALLTGMSGFNITDLEMLNEEWVLQQFKNYQHTLSKRGVYVMLMKFITDYQLKSRLLSENANNGERRLSNTLQLIEILHKKQTRNQFTPVELVSWLQKAIEGQTSEGDEFEQRIENDEDAVKIVTIHKSKGLEYNIVIAPALDLTVQMRDFSGFRDLDGGYTFAQSNLLNESQVNLFNEQQEQENRRLIYVAITRAKYKCFININNSSYNNDSSLKPFVAGISSAMPTGVEFLSSPIVPSGYIYRSNNTHFPVVYQKASDFSLLQLHWRRLSYTYLNPEHEVLPKPIAGAPLDTYSDFIFRKLKKGAFTGNLLHYIFEFMNFSDNRKWNKVISNAMIRLTKEGTGDYSEHLHTLLSQVTNTPIHCNEQSFTLSTVKQEERLSEFEFDFMVKPFQASQINALSTSQVPFHVKSFEELEGIMNGKMDLFFKKEGKYYILDWKSNFLGDRLEDYATEKVWEAMAESNYHLQYHIYTVAICKYLALRIPGFDYKRDFGGAIYLFVRGVREDQNTGIFFHKPDPLVIDQLTACFA